MDSDPDVKEKIRRKLDIEFRNCRDLGARNTAFFHNAFLLKQKSEKGSVDLTAREFSEATIEIAEAVQVGGRYPVSWSVGLLLRELFASCSSCV